MEGEVIYFRDFFDIAMFLASELKAILGLECPAQSQRLISDEVKYPAAYPSTTILCSATRLLVHLGRPIKRPNFSIQPFSIDNSVTNRQSLGVNSNFGTARIINRSDQNGDNAIPVTRKHYGHIVSVGSCHRHCSSCHRDTVRSPSARWYAAKHLSIPKSTACYFSTLFESSSKPSPVRLATAPSPERHFSSLRTKSQFCRRKK
eukprot:IDg8882t1